MLKVLAIGNSFSEDATACLYDMAAADGKEIKVVNLYIPACSLETHWKNVLSDAAEYEYQLNGNRETGRLVSLSQALSEDEWDFVVMQQASRDSGIDTSYYPYIKSLSTFVKRYAPGAQQYMHQVWAYEQDSDHPGFANYGNNQATMQRQINMAVLGAARNIKAKILPCGELFAQLRAMPGFDYANGGQSLCRDGFHAHLVYGRYTLAAVWYEVLFGGNVLENTYLPASEEPVDPELIAVIQQTVHSAITK